jgi:hypothetical protein
LTIKLTPHTELSVPLAPAPPPPLSGRMGANIVLPVRYSVVKDRNIIEPQMNADERG